MPSIAPPCVPPLPVGGIFLAFGFFFKQTAYPAGDSLHASTSREASEIKTAGTQRGAQRGASRISGLMAPSSAVVPPSPPPAATSPSLSGPRGFSSPAGQQGRRPAWLLDGTGGLLLEHAGKIVLVRALAQVALPPPGDGRRPPPPAAATPPVSDCLLVSALFH